METASTDSGCSVEYYPVDLEMEKRRYTTQYEGITSRQNCLIHYRGDSKCSGDRLTDIHTSDMFQQSLLQCVAVFSSNHRQLLFILCHIEG